MTITFIQGDVREKLFELPSDFFDCIVTSPPYFGLRDYGTATWEGGDPACDHVGRDSRSVSGGPGKQYSNAGSNRVYSGSCSCGARRIDAQIGLEPTLDAYLETMVAVCRELRRVLKPSGVCFINIGDSFATGTTAARNPTSTQGQQVPASWSNRSQSVRCGTPLGLKTKDLMLVPQRLGIALQADGWWVRSHIIWHKPNPMPESVTDRPTSAHETIWMLTKSERYYWDADAVAEKALTGACLGGNLNYRAGTEGKGLWEGNQRKDLGRTQDENITRNIRNVWIMTTQPFAEAHFATFPPELAERCIKAACPIDGNVLDPFGGSGTTAMVANRLDRNASLIELNSEYIEMAKRRIEQDQKKNINNAEYYKSRKSSLEEFI